MHWRWTMSDERWTVDRYLKADTDPHLWASLSLGDWQNLFEEALERMQEAEQDVRKWQERATLYGQADEVERLRAAIWQALDYPYANRQSIDAILRRALTKPKGE
jgi:hypothetical protein